ncbi:MAG TPA: outer membrane protein assembly factor BamD [Afifellaceae bacterium]|nr:outer membrane protein assembly factor BamD [Afifellaceae bacterium]
MSERSISNFAISAAGFSVKTLAGLLVALSLAGCSSFLNKADTDEFTEADPPDLLYNQGLAYLNAGDINNASKKFKSIDEQHPYSEYARRSMIMSAYVNFRRGRYPETINDAKRYVTLFPASEDAAYAQYLIGESHFRQIPDVTRDQQASIQAIQAMNQVIVNYPESEYASDARNKIQIASDQIAGKEMQVGRYYQERREYLAAINRFKTVVNDFQSTRHVEEALHRLTESYLALGIVQEAQTSAAVLGHNFPDSKWYQDSYRILGKGGVEPKENRDSWMSRAFRKVSGA